MGSLLFEGTAKEVRTRLANVPDDERVRVLVGSPALGIVARRLQAEAAANGMIDEIHDELMRSFKTVR